jgi:hypothetical protein
MTFNQINIVREAILVDDNGLVMSYDRESHSPYVGVTADTNKGYWLGYVSVPSEYWDSLPGEGRSQGTLYLIEGVDPRYIAFVVQTFLRLVMERGWESMLDEVESNRNWSGRPSIPVFEYPAEGPMVVPMEPEAHPVLLTPLQEKEVERQRELARSPLQGRLDQAVEYVLEELGYGEDKMISANDASDEFGVPVDAILKAMVA